MEGIFRFDYKKLFRFNYLNKYICFIFFILFVVLLFFRFDNNVKSIIDKTNDSYRLLEFKDFILVFLLNFISVLICYLLSYIGLGIPYISLVLFRVFTSVIIETTHNWKFLVTMLPHAILEMLVMYILFEISIDNFKKLYNLYKGDLKSYNIDYRRNFLRLVVIIIVLIIAALIEVYISNRIFLYFNKIDY